MNGDPTNDHLDKDAPAEPGDLTDECPPSDALYRLAVDPDAESPPHVQSCADCQNILQTVRDEKAAAARLASFMQKVEEQARAVAAPPNSARDYLRALFPNLFDLRLSLPTLSDLRLSIPTLSDLRLSGAALATIAVIALGVLAYILRPDATVSLTRNDAPPVVLGRDAVEEDLQALWALRDQLKEEKVANVDESSQRVSAFEQKASELSQREMSDRQRTELASVRTETAALWEIRKKQLGKLGATPQQFAQQITLSAEAKQLENLYAEIGKLVVEEKIAPTDKLANKDREALNAAPRAAAISLAAGQIKPVSISSEKFVFVDLKADREDKEKELLKTHFNNYSTQTKIKIQAKLGGETFSFPTGTAAVTGALPSPTVAVRHSAARPQ